MKLQPVAFIMFLAVWSTPGWAISLNIDPAPPYSMKISVGSTTLVHGDGRPAGDSLYFYAQIPSGRAWSCATGWDVGFGWSSGCPYALWAAAQDCRLPGGADRALRLMDGVTLLPTKPSYGPGQAHGFFICVKGGEMWSTEFSPGDPPAPPVTCTVSPVDIVINGTASNIPRGAATTTVSCSEPATVEISIPMEGVINMNGNVKGVVSLDGSGYRITKRNVVQSKVDVEFSVSTLAPSPGAYSGSTALIVDVL